MSSPSLNCKKRELSDSSVTSPLAVMNWPLYLQCPVPYSKKMTGLKTCMLSLSLLGIGTQHLTLGKYKLVSLSWWQKENTFISCWASGLPYPTSDFYPREKIRQISHKAWEISLQQGCCFAELKFTLLPLESSWVNRQGTGIFLCNWSLLFISLFT